MSGLLRMPMRPEPISLTRLRMLLAARTQLWQRKSLLSESLREIETLLREINQEIRDKEKGLAAGAEIQR